MPLADALPVFAGAAVIGLVHGAEPGHGWPVAAAYALDREHRWLEGLAASVLLGLGHLVSSLAVVFVYFLAISYFDLTQVNDPLSVLGVEVGGPVGIAAGVLLVVLGVREYRHGHSHDIGDGDSPGSGHTHDHGGDDAHDHGRGHGSGDPLNGVTAVGGHGDHGHGVGGHADGRAHGRPHSHDHGRGGWKSRVASALPFVGGGHSHEWDADGAGLTGIVWTAFVLGFAHEEEFEIIGLCTGSTAYCLPLMLVYSLAVLLALVALTLGLVAGYERYEERVERYADHLPTVSAAVLVVMGLGFALGLF